MDGDFTPEEVNKTGLVELNTTSLPSFGAESDLEQTPQQGDPEENHEVEDPPTPKNLKDEFSEAARTPVRHETQTQIQTPSILETLESQINAKPPHEDSPPGVAASQPRNGRLEEDAQERTPLMPSLNPMGLPTVAPLRPSLSPMGGPAVADTNAQTSGGVSDPGASHIPDKVAQEAKRKREKYKETERIAEALRKECVHNKELSRKWE